MQTLEVTQGSEEWHAARAQYECASEAAAMMGASKHMSRTDLLRMKATGDKKEFSAWVQRNLLDKGHEVEAPARALAEEIIGEDLYPVTGVNGTLLASFDGLTMDETIAWEHKLWNEDLAAAVRAGALPASHFWQLEHQCAVGAQKVLFMVSDGTRERCVWMWYEPTLQKELLAGWKQFAEDVANYQHVEVIPAAKGATLQNLPIPKVQVNGAMTVVSDLDKWGGMLHAFIDGLNLKPETDQHFADLESGIKVLQAAQDALKVAEDMALAATPDVDTLRKTVAELTAVARDTRLKVEKLVAAEKTNIRARILKDGEEKLAAHIKKLNERLGKPFMPPIAADFAGAMKGKKTVASLRDAVDTTLAKAKIIANEAADAIEINLKVLAAIADHHKPLFPDAAALVLKASDDLEAIVKARISDAEQAAQCRAESERVAQAALKVDSEPPANVHQLPPRAPAGAAPTLKLGQIGERLGFVLTADFLKSLGFEGVRDRSSLLFHEADFPHICAALIKHINTVQAKQAA